MTDPLVAGLAKLPSFAGVSFRALRAGEAPPPAAGAVVAVMPSTSNPDCAFGAAGVRTVVVLLNRTARDVSALSPVPAAGEVVTLPGAALRTVGAFEFPGRPVDFLVIEEIATADAPDPSWPTSMDAIVHLLSGLVPAPPPAGVDVGRYAGPMPVVAAPRGEPPARR